MFEIEEDDAVVVVEEDPRPYLIEKKQSFSSGSQSTVSLTEKDLKKEKYSYKKLNSIGMFMLTMLWLAVIPLVLYFFHKTPHTYTRQEDYKNLGKFLGYRADNFVKEYTALGSRWFGHYEFWNSHEYLRNRIDEILNDHYSNKLEFEIDIDALSGSFYKGKVLYYFKDFANIAVKIYPARNGTYPTLLMSACYDSYHASPGAGAANNIGVFLELLRVFIVMTPEKTANFNATLLFLFIGAQYNRRVSIVHFAENHRWRFNIS